MASWGMHSEITHSLDTDSLIQALRGVIAHKVNINILYSNNGANFVRCENKLKKAYQEMGNEGIQPFLNSFGGDLVRWIRKPAATSHMGGVWKRKIRSAHAILLYLQRKLISNCERIPPKWMTNNCGDHQRPCK